MTPGLLAQFVLATAVLTVGVMLAAVGALLAAVLCWIAAAAWLVRSMRQL